MLATLELNGNALAFLSACLGRAPAFPSAFQSARDEGGMERRAAANILDMGFGHGTGLNLLLRNDSDRTLSTSSAPPTLRTCSSFAPRSCRGGGTVEYPQLGRFLRDMRPSSGEITSSSLPRAHEEAVCASRKARWCRDGPSVAELEIIHCKVHQKVEYLTRQIHIQSVYQQLARRATRRQGLPCLTARGSLGSACGSRRRQRPGARRPLVF